MLNDIGSVKGQKTSNDQFFKDLIDVMNEHDKLFDEENQDYDYILHHGVTSCNNIAQRCNFKIEVGQRHLPIYEMSPEEKIKYGTRKKMFLDLIEEGIDRTNILDKYTEDEVYDRLEEEIKVIIGAKVYDYFLITWDGVRFCEKNNILVGLGRGSAAGCLVSYLLGIVKINPLDYGLIFERFLNPGRAKKSLPDIDMDHEVSRRDEVKKYFEDKYGHNYMSSVGTFGTIQIKSAIKDINRTIGTTDAGGMDYISKMTSGKGFKELFEEAAQKPQLKKWISQNTHIVNLIPLCHNSPKSQSVHPCATIVVPKQTDEDGKEMTIFDSVPIRADDEGMLVTEWGGDQIEQAGFLKQDILGVRQLDKFRNIISLVKESTGKDIDIYSIPTDDDQVYKFFKAGFCMDVFHFGSEGLTNYLRMVKPDTIDDLINANALYRPGPMMSKSHMEYVKLKAGEKQPHYDYMLKNITKDTYGLIIFQEQIMKTCQILGGFSLSESDDIRKAMGKKKFKLIQEYKSKFIKSAIEKKCPEQEADDIWQKMEVFAAYGFNLSHTVAYAITGYICNWLKYHYPTQFWVTALQHSKEDQIPKMINEIRKTGSTEIMPPDINSSDVGFKADYKDDRIFWSITKISNVGEATVKSILDNRDNQGKFFSMKEFLKRIEKKTINKRVVTNMILSGCFDLIYDIKNVIDRKQILLDFYELREIKEKEHAEWIHNPSAKNEWFWILKQHEVSGLGDMSYKKVMQFTKTFANNISEYVDNDEFYYTEAVDKHVVIAGIIIEAKEKPTKKGMMGVITIDCNATPITIRVWNDMWEGETSMRDSVMKSKDRILFISGKVSGPSIYNADNILQTSSRGKVTKFEIL